MERSLPDPHWQGSQREERARKAELLTHRSDTIALVIITAFCFILVYINMLMIFLWT